MDRSDSLCDDKPQEECGIFGIWAPRLDVARLTFFGLQALQHRGQESAGIAVTDGNEIECVKGCGLAREVCDDETISSLRGKAAIGHVRYATSGKHGNDDLRMAHPFVESGAFGTFALAHNGTLTNPGELMDALAALDEDARAEGGCSDTQLAAMLLAALMDRGGDALGALMGFMDMAKGAYSLVALLPDALFCMRDQLGVRPLCVGKLPEGGWVVASETCALDLIGAEYVRDVRPGEVLRFDECGMHSSSDEGSEEDGLVRSAKRASCIFEYVYFARPDSVIDGASIYRAREAMGRQLYRESEVDADIVIGVPDSGIPAAIGYARESGMTYSEGIIKNRYIDRTFIQPTQELREQGIRIKLNPLHYAVRNRKIIVVDDSIVRGSTSKQLVDMLRSAGAKEVHMRITSPPIAWPCFLGINTDVQEQLIAATKSVNEICECIGADSLAYLSLEGLKSCIYAEHPSFCTACFDGKYPIARPVPLADGAFMEGSKPQWAS